MVIGRQEAWGHIKSVNKTLVLFGLYDKKGKNFKRKGEMIFQSLCRSSYCWLWPPWYWPLWFQMWWMNFYQILSKELDELSVWVSLVLHHKKHILTTSMWQLPSFSCWFEWQSFKWRKRKSHVQPRRNCYSSSRIKEYNIIIMVLFCYPSTCKTADFLLALTLFAIIAIETCQGRWTHAPLLLFVWIKIHPHVTLYWISRRK